MNSNSHRRVLVIEDETLIGMLLEDMLLDLGYQVVAYAADFAEGLRLVQTAEIDLVVLDLDLRGVSTLAIADVLRERGIPFFFSSGFGTAAIDEAYRDVPCLRKPFLIPDLERMIALVLPAAEIEG
jgi:CheY-like chemotaxis protein